MSETPKKPTCTGCPHNFTYSDFVPMRKMGVMMHLNERFCTGGKKARRFKRNDPKIHTPVWCPKRKDPCELRVYSFKSSDDWMMHTMLSSSIGQELPPEGYRYALTQELHTKLTPRDFWERCKLETSAELLSVEVELHDVVEIDDGLKPVFFYKTEMGYTMPCRFDAEAAKKNHKEGCV